MGGPLMLRDYAGRHPQTFVSALVARTWRLPLGERV